MHTGAHIHVSVVCLYQDDAVTNALLCLRAQETELDVYTTALLAYTYTLYDPATPERAVLMEKLSALAKSGGTYIIEN